MSWRYHSVFNCWNKAGLTEPVTYRSRPCAWNTLQHISTPINMAELCMGPEGHELGSQSLTASEWSVSRTAEPRSVAATAQHPIIKAQEQGRHPAELQLLTTASRFNFPLVSLTVVSPDSLSSKTSQRKQVWSVRLSEESHKNQETC